MYNHYIRSDYVNGASDDGQQTKAAKQAGSISPTNEELTLQQGDVDPEIHDLLLQRFNIRLVVSPLG